MKVIPVEQYNQVFDFIQVTLSKSEQSWLQKTAVSFVEQLKRQSEDYVFLGNYENETITGVLGYQKKDMTVVVLLVGQQYRHHGIGTNLIKELDVYCQNMNFSQIRANVLNIDHNFYETYGFEQAGEQIVTDTFVMTPMEYYVNQDYLGKMVTVIVDRPYGSFHLQYSDVTYPCNAGYVKERIPVEDGEFQDAYIIGVEEPVESFTGVVVGIIYRKSENQSKWIVMPVGMTINHDEIIQRIGLEEQHYETRIIWK